MSISIKDSLKAATFLRDHCDNYIMKQSFTRGIDDCNLLLNKGYSPEDDIMEILAEHGNPEAAPEVKS